MANTRQVVCGRSGVHVVPDRSPGPLGLNDAADPNTEISHAGDTCGPVGTNGDQASLNADHAPKTNKLTLNCLELGRDALLRFLRSVATTVAIDELTVVKGGGGPLVQPLGLFPKVDQLIIRLVAGEETIELASHADVEKETLKLASEYMQQLVDAIPQGGAEVFSVLKDLQYKKDFAKASTQRKFDSVQQYNNERVQAFTVAAQAAAVVKFGSTVILKTAGVFAGLPGIAIGIGYDVTVKAIKDFSAAQDADVVTVTVEAAKKEGGKDLKEEAQKKAAEKGTEMWHDYVSRFEEKLTKLRQQVLENRLSSKKMRGVAKRLSRAEAEAGKAFGSPSAALAAAKRSAALKWAGKGVSWAFWVKDMGEAWEELMHDLESTK